LIDALRARARERRKRIVLPEVDDARTRAARAMLERESLAEIVWIESPKSDPRFEAVAAHLLARRAAKGMTPAQAREAAAQPLFFAAGLVALGHADASVAGAAHATADVIRAGLQCVGTAPGVPVVSSMFLMVRGEEALSYADCGVLPAPDAAQLAAIAAATAQNHRLFTGEEPRVAFLSFSTRGSAEHASLAPVREALARFRAAHPEIAADGELQFDAAYVPDVAARKAKGSPLAGRANVFVFPDLNAGNLAYKITERLGGFRAFGPLIQGLARPCLDLSRGCSAEDIVDVAVLAAIMCG
jgi:phosphate acetyltransferase